MQTSEDIIAAVAASSSKSVQSRRTLYVGGLDDFVTQSLLRAALIPFGPIKSVELVQDYSNRRTVTHKGFGFVEFEDANDAAEAVFNMDGAELLGRVLNVSVAQKSNQHRLGSNKPIWSSDEWLREQVAGAEVKGIKANEERQAVEASALK